MRQLVMLAMAFMPSFGLLGLQRRQAVASNPGTPTGDGTMDFSNADDSGLIILLEDI
jgi:hypothetical protein